MSNNVSTYLDYIRYIDELIRKRSGGPKELANSLNMSEKNLRRYINLMRDYGAPIKFNRKLRIYEYTENGKFVVGWVKFKVYAEIEDDD